MEKLKVGMVGIGRATAYGSVFSHNEKTEVVALCDMDRKNSQRMQKILNWMTSMFLQIMRIF